MILIINADDFGLDEQTNRAIVASFQSRLCSSTTIMPNMPGFENACQLAHEHKLIDYVGMHLVLADGCPLTGKIRKLPKFCNEQGELCFSQRKPTFRLSAIETEALGEEIRAQIALCRNNGIPLTHLDSHYHIHNQWGIASVLVPILREQRIPYLRITRNCGPELGLAKRFYKTIYNRKLKKEGLARTQYFGALDDYNHLIEKRMNTDTIKSFELLIHPKYDDDGILLDGVSKWPLEQKLKQFKVVGNLQERIL